MTPSGGEGVSAAWEPHTFCFISLNIAAASLALLVLEQRCNSAAYDCASGDILSFLRALNRNIVLIWLPLKEESGRGCVGEVDRTEPQWDGMGSFATYITHTSAKTDQTSCQESSPAKWLTFSLHPINILLHTLLLNRCPWRRYLLKMGSACCT